jgi:hypothetical protein
VKLPSNGCLIGDMGYDAKQLRVDLAFRGTATVIQPIRRTNTNGTSTARLTKIAILSSGHGVGSKISAVSQLAMTNSPAILLPPWRWQPSLFGGLIESAP